MNDRRSKTVPGVGRGGSPIDGSLPAAGTARHTVYSTGDWGVGLQLIRARADAMAMAMTMTVAVAVAAGGVHDA